MTSKNYAKLLALIACAALLMGFALTAQAATVVKQVDLKYTASKIGLNTAWTEGEVRDRISGGAVTISTTGCSLDTMNTNLNYQNGTSWWGIGDGTTRVQASRQYAVNYAIQLDSGYDWYPAIKTLTANDTPISACPDFYVYVNGTKRTDVYLTYNAYWNTLHVVVPLPAVSTKGIVTSMSINSNNFTMAVGTSHTFKVSMEGSVTDKSVTWSVTGNKSTATKITTAGKLTVASAETAKKITVKAVSKEDTSASAKVVITLSQKAPTITGVTVAPGTFTLYQGGTLGFSVEVTGTQSDKSVTWSVTGAKSANTYISESGTLFVGQDETAAKLTVKAAANQKKTKYGTATVTVKKAAKVTKVNVTYDRVKVGLSPKNTEKKINEGMYAAIGVGTKGCRITSGQLLKREGSLFTGADPSAKANMSSTYYIKYYIALDTGYVWPDSVKALGDSPVLVSKVSGFSVKVNGAARNKIYVSFWDNVAAIYVPAEWAIDVSAAKVTGFVKSFDYTGKAIKQSVTVKLYGKTLSAGTDYKITYTDNKAAGKATMTITGLGNYVGTLSKKYTIKPVEITSAKLEYTKIKYTGKALKPTATVKATVNGKTVTLKAGTDYTITYKNNKAVGTATVTIKGTGNFKGTITKTFKITKK